MEHRLRKGSYREDRSSFLEAACSLLLRLPNSSHKLPILQDPEVNKWPLYFCGELEAAFVGDLVEEDSADGSCCWRTRDSPLFLAQGRC